MKGNILTCNYSLSQPLKTFYHTKHKCSRMSLSAKEDTQYMAKMSN